MEIDDALMDQTSQDSTHLNNTTGSSEKNESVIQILQKEI